MLQLDTFFKELENRIDPYVEEALEQLRMNNGTTIIPTMLGAELFIMLPKHGTLPG